MKIIGIDAGTSNIKIIAIDENEKILNKKFLNKKEITQAFEEFLEQSEINESEISKVVITGIGQTEVNGDIHGIQTVKIDEFEAVGTGATFSANLEDALIISVGTGTAFIKANNGKYTHIGGTGIGGGTLINLCKKFAGINSFSEIEERIKDADIEKIDLRLKDIKKDAINDLLPAEITVANFGKLTEDATANDVILGVVNLIAETIGMMGIFATQNMQNKNIIVVGSITELTHIKKVLNMLSKLQNVNYIIPENAEWIGAIGAIKAC
jgi:type II pantothenate kinase